MKRLLSRRGVLRGLRITAVALTLWMVISFLVAYRLTRRSRARFDEPLPTVVWAKFQPHRIETPDGEELGAWLFDGKPDAPSILLLHGNGGSRKNCLDRAEIFAAQGYTVLMISLRAHGDSSGDFNDIGYGARTDVVAAVGLLEQLRPGGPIIIHGTSMGAAAAAFASGKLANRVRGYVLECPYADLKTAVWNRLDNALPPLLDRVAYLGMMTVAPLVIPELENISPLNAIEGVPKDVPILILAGGRDTRARPDEARAIFDRATTHARLSIFEDADHLKLLATEPERYKREVLGFFAEVNGRSARK